MIRRLRPHDSGFIPGRSAALRLAAVALVALALAASAPSPARAKALLGEPEVDRASDQYDGLWCPAEQIQSYDGEFTADGPRVTLVFIAANHVLGGWRRERIDNVVIVPADDYATYKHLPDSVLAANYGCIEPMKNYFHFSDVPPANLVYLEKFPAGAPPGWDLTDGAYSIPGASALNAFEMPIDATGGSLGLGLDEDPSAEATTEITISGLTADEAYVVSTWTGCIDASVGHDLLIQVYGTEYFALAGWQPVDTSVGRGLAWGDYDWDGDLDVFVTNFNSSSRLWRNDGGSFVDRTSPSGLAFSTQATAVSWVDADNDYDLDLYVGSGGPDRYYRNLGNGTFVNATVGPLGDTRQTECIDWGDYDRDGDLDLYIGNVETDALLRNDGGVFVDVASGSLLGSGTPSGCSWVDTDDDGDLDLFVTYSQQANELFVNQNGTLAKATPAILALAAIGTTASWADYDNDGDLDVYFTTSNGPNRLLRNNGNNGFTNVTPSVLTNIPAGIESVWSDFDNDGLIDLYLARSGQANILFQNKGGGSFVVRNTGTIENAGTAGGAAFGDADQDGDSDLFLVNANGVVGGQPDAYYLNEFGSERSWLEIDLKGSPSNRFGIGAKVFVTAGAVTQMREVGGESGLRSQNSLTADFGLGTSRTASQVRVEWPSGAVQVIANVDVGQRMTIEENGSTGVESGGAGPEAVTALRLHPNVPNPFRATTTIEYELPAPGRAELRIYDVAGRVVRTLDRAAASAGSQRAEWDGRDDAGRPVVPGIYFYELRAGGESATRKMVRVE